MAGSKACFKGTLNNNNISVHIIGALSRAMQRSDTLSLTNDHHDEHTEDKAKADWGIAMAIHPENP
jgi:hypothetical protein